MCNKKNRSRLVQSGSDMGFKIRAEIRRCSVRLERYHRRIDRWY